MSGGKASRNKGTRAERQAVPLARLAQLPREELAPDDTGEVVVVLAPRTPPEPVADLTGGRCALWDDALLGLGVVGRRRSQQLVPQDRLLGGE